MLDKVSGALSKYANTYATTAISQYAGENNKILTYDLGLEWFEYVGSNIETTREFCDHLTEKRYIHKSEIKTILKGEIDGYQCEIYEKTGLPKGMIEGTNEQNFQVNCGGWNCRHQLVPVAKEAVPLDIRAKFEEQETSTPTKAQKPTKTEDEKKKIQERWTQRRLKNMESELSNNLTKEEKTAISEHNLELEKELGITKGNPMSVEEADKQHANPNFGKSREYRINCQTCAPAYALRLMGFNVTAKPKTKGSQSEYLARQRSFEAWTNIDGSKPTPTLTYDWMIKKGYKQMNKKRYEEYFEESCKDVGVYILTIGWKGGGGHATILQRFEDGTLKYIEPQSYSASKGVKRGIEDLSIKGATKPISTRGILRVDNKLFNTKFASIFNK